jgi:hypothetical protein
VLALSGITNWYNVRKTSVNSSGFLSLFGWQRNLTTKYLNLCQIEIACLRPYSWRNNKKWPSAGTNLCLLKYGVQERSYWCISSYLYSLHRSIYFYSLPMLFVNIKYQ